MKTKINNKIMEKLEKEKEKPLPSTLDMLLYLAWWKICDVEEYLRKVFKKEKN